MANEQTSERKIIIERSEKPPQNHVVCDNCGYTLVKLNGNGYKIMGKDITLMNKPVTKVQGVCTRCNTRFEGEL